MNKGDLVGIRGEYHHTLWSVKDRKATFSDPVRGRLYEVAEPQVTAPAGYRKWRECVQLQDPVTGETFYTRTASAYVVATIMDVDDYMAS
jgi:hypothetical protein